jgi:hypothetical protein
LRKIWVSNLAYHGLTGDIVRTIAPQSEAAPEAILAQMLAAFGNIVGRGPFYHVEGDKHSTNLFFVLVGETSKGRKGTSWGRVEQTQIRDIFSRNKAGGSIERALELLAKHRVAVMQTRDTQGRPAEVWIAT